MIIRFMTEISYNMQQVLAAKASFEQANPDVQIEVEQVNDNFEMMQAFHSDEAPDIIETGGFPVGNPDGLFIDLAPYVAETNGLEEDLYPGLMRVARFGGTLPGLPIEISPPLVLYNKEKFDQAGFAYPDESWTWEDMVELAKRLTIRDAQGVASQFGFGLGVDIEWFEPFVMRNGGDYISPDGLTARGFVDSAATIEAFRMVIEAFREHRIIRKPDEPCLTNVWYEESAMLFAFNWVAHHWLRERPEAQIGVVGLPNMPGQTNVNMIYMGGAGVTSKSQNPRIAWAFLRHYLLDCHSWMPPAIQSQAEQRGLTSHPLWSRYLEEIDHVQISGFFKNRKWNASRQLINEDIRKMILEGADVAQTLKSWTRYT
ncbi:ABC transporter substrate-binding protein [Paenibacillus nasutitermitis]|uniref:Sugar ABC transporter substrate-binding protein n=1 Tax=Paenibacillus nasutitermitis TaxID=1652958 RepID=A0A916Z703_9BACL|nr:extracellular solute-binding protein [Paenibacillus nasutitermitis]GGD79371.1 sugar ABC transporter substrate-binding protein [Paenibacillus nasutitermitis]